MSSSFSIEKRNHSIDSFVSAVEVQDSAPSSSFTTREQHDEIEIDRTPSSSSAHNRSNNNKTKQQSKHQRNNKNNNNNTRYNNDEDKNGIVVVDEIGEAMTRMLNENPNFHYFDNEETTKSSSGGNRRRKRGRRNNESRSYNNNIFPEGSDSNSYDYDTISFRPLFSVQNYNRVKVLLRCIYILFIRNCDNLIEDISIPNGLNRIREEGFSFLSFRKKTEEEQQQKQKQHTTLLNFIYETILMKFILPIISIIIFFWIIIATCIGFTSVHIWKLGYFISFLCSSILIDWNEISNLLLPIWIQQYDIINKSKQLFKKSDRIILKGNRWRGREWNKKGFEFNIPSNQAQSSLRNCSNTSSSSLWKLPPPNVLKRSYKNKNNSNTSVARSRSNASLIQSQSQSQSSQMMMNPSNEDITTTIEHEDHEEHEKVQQQQQQNNDDDEDVWGPETIDHVNAIDYCYLVLREAFIQQQYIRLQQRRQYYYSSYTNPSTTTSEGTSTAPASSSSASLLAAISSKSVNDNDNNDDDHDKDDSDIIRQRLPQQDQYDYSSISSYENFRQKFVLDPDSNNNSNNNTTSNGSIIDPDNLNNQFDEVTGFSLRLQEILEGTDSFDDPDYVHDENNALPTQKKKNNRSNVVANNSNNSNNNNTNNNISNGVGTIDSDDCGSRSFDTESDGTTTDLNWMDVGTKIGMKLLGSAAVQKAMASQDTVEKISTLKERVEDAMTSEKDKKRNKLIKDLLLIDGITPLSSSTMQSTYNNNDNSENNGAYFLEEDSADNIDDDNLGILSDLDDDDDEKVNNNSNSNSEEGQHQHYHHDSYGNTVPVNPMWTSAAAALSPTHSCATADTTGSPHSRQQQHRQLPRTLILPSSSPRLSSLSSKTSKLICRKKQQNENNNSKDHDNNNSSNNQNHALPRNKDLDVASSSHNGGRTDDVRIIDPSHEGRREKQSINESELASKTSTTTTTKIVQHHHYQRRRSSIESVLNPCMEMIVPNKNDHRKVLIKQVSSPKLSNRRSLLLPGVKIAVPIIPIQPPIHPGRPKQKKTSSRKLRKSRFQMGTVVSSKRICVYEKNNMPRSGHRGTNCLTITVNLDKCFLRNGNFALMTVRIMDEWGPRYMPKHSKLPVGTCVATSFGLGVLVGWRVEDDMHLVRSLWQRRGSGSACAYLRRDSIHATMEAAIGFDVTTSIGRGTVVAYTSGGTDFRFGRYFVSIAEEGRHYRQVLELKKSDILSCESAQYIPIIEHIRAAAQYQLQIDRYKELHDKRSNNAEENNNKAWGEFSRHFNILWKSFLRAIEEDGDEFDDGMNEFIQSCVNFLNQLDAPNGGSSSSSETDRDNDDNINLDASFVIYATDSSKSQSQYSKSASSRTGVEGEKSDSGFWLMNNIFDIFKESSSKNDDPLENYPPVEGIEVEVQCTPRRRRRSDKNYARAFAALRTLTRTVTIAQAGSADEPNFKIALSICHEFFLFVKTVIKVQQKNMNHDSLEVWRSAWCEIVSVFGPVKDRLKRIGEGIAERMERHGRRAKVRLLRFVDFIVQDDALFLAMEQGDWGRCAEQIESAMVQAKIIDEQSREHYHKTAQFLYSHFSSATSRSTSAADRINEKLAQFLLAIQLVAAPRKAMLNLFLQDWVLDILERIFVRAFAKEELASRMLTIHCSNFQTLRRFRMLKDFTIAGKLWIPLLDAADEEFSWAVSKLPEDAKAYVSPLSSLFSLCVSQFHKIDKGDLTKDWLDFLMEEDAAEIIHDLDMKLILALESFSRDIKETMVVLPYYPSIDDDILNLVDDINVAEFVKEASIALEDEEMLREFIKEKATIAVERFLDYLPKMSIPVEKRDLGEGWTLTCRGADGGDLSLTELIIKRENLTCQVMGGDSVFFPAVSSSSDLDTPSSSSNTTDAFTRSMPSNGAIKETSILDVIKKIILNAQHDGCWKVGVGGINNPPSDRYAASALDNLPVSCVLNCAIDLWRNLEIDDDELLEIAIRDVSYQIELHKTHEEGTDHATTGETKDDRHTTTSTGTDSWQMSKIPSADELCEPLRHRFNPRVDPTVLYLEIKKLTFNLENFLFRIEKHESKKTVFDPAFEGTGSILVRNVLVKFRVECVKGFVQHPGNNSSVPVPVLQLRELDVSLEQVKLEVHDTGADWLLNKIVDGFGDRFAEIISANLCDQVRKQMNEALGNLNGYFAENPEVLLGVLDISLDDLEEMTVFV